MKQKDTAYLLEFFDDETKLKETNYKSFQRNIQLNGFSFATIGNDKVKIYTAELGLILTSKELLAFDTSTSKETTINGWEYLETYIEAYKEGKQYFENEFKVSPDTIYGTNAEQYVRDIHENYFHIQHAPTRIGWVSVKQNFPFLLTHRAIKEFGYFSGIVNKVDEQVKKHPRLFANFDKCEHNLPPQPPTTQNPKLKIDQIALIDDLSKELEYQCKKYGVKTENEIVSLF